MVSIVPILNMLKKLFNISLSESTFINNWIYLVSPSEVVVSNVIVLYLYWLFKVIS